MDKLELFAKKHNLRLQLFAAGEYDIPGREGCIRVVDGQFGIELDDKKCIPGKAPRGFTTILTFDPDDVLEVKLALELIEVTGQQELTHRERKQKVRLLGRLRKSAILRFFARKHGLKFRGQFIPGRAGRIRLLDGELAVDIYDRACVVLEDPAEDIRWIPIFNPEDELQAKLALEVIETAGQKELTRDERKAKVELLEQLRRAEPEPIVLSVIAAEP
jgi:hypothetical protein